MLFCSAGLTYRTLSLQQRVVQVPVPMMISQAPQNANPVKAKEPQPTPFSSVNAPLDTASLRTPTKPQPNVNAQTHLKSTPKEAAKDGGIYMVPANSLSNPEITEPAPKPSTLQFTRHKPQVSERTKNAQPDKEYIMGTLTPVSHDSDSAY